MLTSYNRKTLRALSDDELLTELKSLVKRERELLIEVLHCLKEVEWRHLHLKRHPSMFEFATGELGYANATAQRRIDAMLLLEDLPEVEEEILKGELNLSVACQAGAYFRRENKRREKKGEEKLTRSKQKEIAQSLFNKSTREVERMIVELSPEEARKKEKMKPLPKGETLIQFTASAELTKNMEALIELMSHKNPGKKIETLFEQLVELGLKKYDPKRKRRGEKEEETESLPAPEVEGAQANVETLSIAKSEPQSNETLEQSSIPSRRSRYIPAATRRLIHRKHNSQCTHQDPETGQTCGSRYQVQCDHIIPFSEGGTHAPENLTLRCGAHNRYRAEQMGLWQPVRRN